MSEKGGQYLKLRKKNFWEKIVLFLGIYSKQIEMGQVVRLTESELVGLISKIIGEQKIRDKGWGDACQQTLIDMGWSGGSFYAGEYDYNAIMTFVNPKGQEIRFEGGFFGDKGKSLFGVSNYDKYLKTPMSMKLAKFRFPAPAFPDSDDPRYYRIIFNENCQVLYKFTRDLINQVQKEFPGYRLKK